MTAPTPGPQDRLLPSLPSLAAAVTVAAALGLVLHEVAPGQAHWGARAAAAWGVCYLARGSSWAHRIAATVIAVLVVLVEVVR